MDTQPKAATRKQTLLVLGGVAVFFAFAASNKLWAPPAIEAVQNVGKTNPKVGFLSEFGKNNKVEVHYLTARQRCLLEHQVAPLRPTFNDATFRGNFFERFNTLGRQTPDQFEAAHPELCND